MINNPQELIELSHQFKARFANSKLLDFILDTGYVNRGTYSPDQTRMNMNEGMRELALTIRTMVEESDEAILQHFIIEE